MCLVPNSVPFVLWERHQKKEPEVANRARKAHSVVLLIKQIVLDARTEQQAKQDLHVAKTLQNHARLTHLNRDLVRVEHATLENAWILQLEGVFDAETTKSAKVEQGKHV